MKIRTNRVAITAALTALVSGLLVGSTVSPSPAASGGLVVASYNVAYRDFGGTSILVECRGSVDCKGTIAFEKVDGYTPGADRPQVRKSYSVKRGQKGYIDAQLSPEQMEDVRASGADAVKPTFGNIIVRESRPRSRVFAQKARLTERVYEREIMGVVEGANFNDLDDVTVSLWTVNGLQSRRTRQRDISANGERFSFGKVPLSANNTPTTDFRMSISGTTKNGDGVEWFWRGNWEGEGGAYGGSGNIFGGSPIRVGPSNSDEFAVNFKFGSIGGKISKGSTTSSVNGVEVQAVGAPTPMPSGEAARRSLDEPYCGESYGTAKTDSAGNYRLDLLPIGEKKYAVEVQPRDGNATTLWNKQFGSCLDAREYKNSYAKLIGIPGSGSSAVLNYSDTMKQVQNQIKGQSKFSSSYNASAADHWTSLRTYIPGKSVLNSPLVRAGVSSKTGYYNFNNVPPGTYWLETGRRVNCSAWYPSIYPDNLVYFSGAADRTTERWKTVNGTVEEYAKSVQMGYKRKSPGSGKKGWMYRDACVSYSAGSVRGINVYENGTVTGTRNFTVGKGATISGKVNRRGKTAKEMMVSVYSTSGTLVQRSAYSSSAGNFTIRGVASGNYNVIVNHDSWRGLGRSFSGSKTKRVTAGKSYSVGTLNANF